jgi:hypothetical protein
MFGEINRSLTDVQSPDIVLYYSFAEFIILLVAVTNFHLLIHSQYFLILLPHCISPCFLWSSGLPFTRHFR